MSQRYKLNLLNSHFSELLDHFSLFCTDRFITHTDMTWPNGLHKIFSTSPSMSTFWKAYPSWEKHIYLCMYWCMVAQANTSVATVKDQIDRSLDVSNIDQKKISHQLEMLSVWEPITCFQQFHVQRKCIHSTDFIIKIT